MSCEELGITILSRDAKALAKFYEEVFDLSLVAITDDNLYRLRGSHFTISISMELDKQAVISPMEFNIHINDMTDFKFRLDRMLFEYDYDSAHSGSLKMEDIDGNKINVYLMH